MTTIGTLICNTTGAIAASTPTMVLDPMTGVAAFIPAGAAVNAVRVFRDGDYAVTTGCTMQLGVVGSPAKYIEIGDGITTTQLNSGSVVYKGLNLDVGLNAAAELRIVLNNPLAEGEISFNIAYTTFT